MTHQITFRHEANVTAYGQKRNGNKRPIIAIDLHKTLNSITDFMTTYHVCYDSVHRALYPENGKEIYVKVYKLDENGKKICIGKTRLSLVAHAETAMDAVMESGRHALDELNKAKEENAMLKKELEEYYAWKAEQAAKRKAKEAYEQAVYKAIDKVERRKRIEQRNQEAYQLSIARRQEAERELEELMKGDNNNA